MIAKSSIMEPALAAACDRSVPWLGLPCHLQGDRSQFPRSLDEFKPYPLGDLPGDGAASMGISRASAAWVPKCPTPGGNAPSPCPPRPVYLWWCCVPSVRGSWQKTESAFLQRGSFKKLHFQGRHGLSLWWPSILSPGSSENGVETTPRLPPHAPALSLWGWRPVRVSPPLPASSSRRKLPTRVDTHAHQLRAWAKSRKLLDIPVAKEL